MRPTHKLALLCTLMTATGCRHPYVVPEEPMPPNTILLSQMMRELSAQPGFTDALLAQIDKGGKRTVAAFFVGQVMRLSKGQANPAVLNELVVKKLDA